METATKLTKIVLAGEGGQGVQSVADILAEAGNSVGREALYIPNFGVEQRGGVSVAFVQIGNGKIGSPKFITGDIVVALSERAVKRCRQYVDSETVFIYDNSMMEAPVISDKVIGRQTFQTPAPENMAESIGRKIRDEDSDINSIRLAGAKKILAVPANDIAKEELHPRVFNILVLGLVIELSKVLPPEAVKIAIEEKLGEKFKQSPELKEMNFSAFERGRILGRERYT